VAVPGGYITFEKNVYISELCKKKKIDRHRNKIKQFRLS